MQSSVLLGNIIGDVAATSLWYNKMEVGKSKAEGSRNLLSPREVCRHNANSGVTVFMTQRR